MGKIQSAITGAVMTTLGAVASHSKLQSMKDSNAAALEEQELQSEADAMYGQAYQSGSDSERNNLISRQDEANAIAQHYVMAQKFQKKSLESRIAQLGGMESKEAQDLAKAGKTASQKIKKLHQDKINELKKGAK